MLVSRTILLAVARVDASEPQVAVQSFGGVKEVSAGACGGQGSGNLAGDEAALANAEKDGAVFCVAAGGEEIDGASEGDGHRAVKAVG